MYLGILTKTILIVATIGQELNLLRNLNQEKEKLIKCIENSEYLTDVKRRRGSDLVHTFAKFASEKLLGTRNKDTNFLNNMIESFKKVPHNFPSTSRGEFWNKEIVDSLRTALIHCLDDSDFELCSDTNHLANRRLLPEYITEVDRPEITRFLNLAATTFPENVCSMASTPAGFMTLMRFTIDFVNATVRLYNSFHSDANAARVAVREMWDYRIRNWERPVCYYHYDDRNGRVYTCGCNFDTSRYPDVMARNKKVTSEEVNSILTFTLRYSLNFGIVDDTYNRYINEGMRVYERDFEKLLMQKYRVVTFMFLLRQRGILTEQTEITEDFVYSIPRYEKRILHSNFLYLDRMSTNAANCRRNGVQHPLEEDVIVYLNSRILLIVPHSTDNSTYMIFRPSTTQKPFYRRLGDVYNELTLWCVGNHEVESLAGDANSYPQNNPKDSNNHYRCDATFSAYGKKEARFLVEALSFFTNPSLCTGL